MVARKRAGKMIILERYSRSNLKAPLLSEEKAGSYQEKHPGMQIVFDGDEYALVAIPNKGIPGAVKKPYYFEATIKKGEKCTGPVVVKKFNMKEVPFEAVSDELDKLNLNKKFNGVAGEYTFDGDEKAIIFVPYAVKQKQESMESERSLPAFGIDMVR